MNRPKGNSGAVPTKPPPTRSPAITSSPMSEAGKQIAKSTESNIANNNVVTTSSPNTTTTSPATTKKLEQANTGKEQTSSAEATEPKKIQPTISSATKINSNEPREQSPSQLPENIKDRKEGKGNNNQEQTTQQKTISFSDPPTKSTSSTSTKSAGGTVKPKNAGVSTTVNNNQQSQKQIIKQSNSSNASNGTKLQESGNKAGGGSSSPTNNSTSNVNQQVKPSTKTFPVAVTQQQRHPSNISRSMVSLERSRNFRAYIEKAMNDHKIFSCCGVYPAIRTALKKRGWVEKPGQLACSRSANTNVAQPAKGPEDESDVAWMTRVLKDYPSDFIWVIRRDNIDWKVMTKEQLINRFPKAWFTTKVGIAACLQHMHWFSEAGVSDTFFPRCYRLCLEEERLAFQDDYRLTACMSYLRYFVDTFEAKGHESLADSHSKITPLSVDFAARQLGNYVRMRRHEDIDWLLPPNFMTQHWDAFIHQYYAVVHEKKKLRFDSSEAVHVKYETAKKMLHKVAPYWPQIQLDGVYNMWICKPGARSRGKGIVIMNTVEKILDLLTQSNFRECNWVVQKYIEKPMLIYKTKFDMRQWFLITDWTPLTIWFYKESYVRFCTKPFDLEDFHESIHLCNNAIQCRYQNSDQRDSNLPDENMWSSDTFQAYLKTIGRLDAWPLIYSGMKQAIVGVLLASQETVESRKGCYELYGADFMLTDDFRPWLIEINSCPCMSASTSVTARMCAQCLEDTVKVVVDRRHNRNADTGMFEMIYRQNVGSVLVQQFSGHDLTIVGKKLTRDIDWPMAMSKSVTNTIKSKVNSQAALAKSKSENNSGSGKQTLSELLQKLRVRNQEMFQGTLATQQSQIESIFDSSTPTVSSGKTDTAALIEKMRSLKSTLPDQEGLTPAKKINPLSDQTKSKTNASTLNPIKAEKLRSSPPPAEKDTNQGKGEEPSHVSSKFADLNSNSSSIAYLMRNSHNGSGLIGDLIRATKETAQEMISRTKKLEASKKLPTLEEPVAKTLAEVKAMVDSLTLGRHSKDKQQSGESESHGKIEPPIPLTQLSSILLQSNDSQEKEVNYENPFSRKTQLSPTFHNSNQEVTSSTTDNTWNSHYPAKYARNTSPKDPLIHSRSGSPIHGPSNITRESLGECSRNVEGSKSCNLELSPVPCVAARGNDDPMGVKSLAYKNTTIFGRGTSSNGSNYAPYHGQQEEKVSPDLNRHNISIPEIYNDGNDALQKLSTYLVEQAKEEKNDNLNKNCEDTKPPISEENIESLPRTDSNDNSKVAQLLQELMKHKNVTDEGDQDPNSKMYRSVLLSSASFPSSCDSDSDFNNNTDITQPAPNFMSIPLIEGNSNSVTESERVQVNADTTANRTTMKPKPARNFQRRGLSSGSRRCSKRYPCYRVVLEPQNYQQQRFILNNKRKSGPTLPMKTVNLLLPSNYSYY